MRSSDQAPLPSPIMAAPQPGAPVLATRVEPVPVPRPVAAPPAVERAAGSRKADLFLCRMRLRRHRRSRRKSFQARLSWYRGQWW